MRRDELVNKLLECANSQPHVQGRKVLAQFFAQYFLSLTIPAEQERQSWPISRHLPTFLVHAIEVLVHSDEKWVADYRRIFEASTGYPFRNPIKIESGADINSGRSLEVVGGLMTEVAMDLPELEHRLQSAIHAQRTLAAQTFWTFAYHVLVSGGLYEQLVECSWRASLQCGQIALEVWGSDPKATIVFRRGDEHIGFVLSKSDKFGYSAYAHRCNTPIQNAVSIVETARAGWQTGSSTFTPLPPT